MGYPELKILCSTMTSVMTGFFLFYACFNLDKLVLEKCGIRGEDDMKELHLQFGMLTWTIIPD